MQDLIQILILLALVAFMVWKSGYFFVRAASEKAAKRYEKRSKALLQKTAARALRWLAVDLPTIVGRGVAYAARSGWNALLRLCR